MPEFAIAEVISGTRQTPLFLFCDHASNAMPAARDGLGLSKADRASHIAWDIGAGAVTRSLAFHFGAPAVLCGFSRLLIDPNRALDRADVLLTESDGVVIPGNRDAPAGEREARIRTYFEPYHRTLENALDAACRRTPHPLVVSVHSFTRRLATDPADRPWDIGVLWNHDPDTAARAITHLRTATGYEIGDNQPYDARVFNYSVDRHVASRNLRHLTLEIRQDRVDTEEGAGTISEMLAGALKVCLEAHAPQSA